MAKDYVIGDKVWVVRMLTESQGRAGIGRRKHPPIYEAFGPLEIVDAWPRQEPYEWKLANAPDWPHARSRWHRADEMYRRKADAEKAARKRQVGNA